MANLAQSLKSFNGNSYNSEKSLYDAFKGIAEDAINGGYFMVGEDKLRILDIEFYYYDEKPDAPNWKKDFSKYRRGKDYPYISKVGTFLPHQSGVDITFENEEQQYRASFLIRGFSYWNHENGKTEVIDKPTYLWDYLFAEYCSIEQGFAISWHNGLDEFEEIKLDSTHRHEIYKYSEDGKKLKDLDTERKWRFKRL